MKRLFSLILMAAVGCGGSKSSPAQKHLLTNANDPTSVEIVSEIPLGQCPLDAGCDLVYVKFREKNKLGALELKRRVYHVANGKVTSSLSEVDIAMLKRSEPIDWEPISDTMKMEKAIGRKLVEIEGK